MKNLFVIWLMLLSITSMGQESYQEIIEAQGISKYQLFKRAEMAATRLSANSNSTIEIRDSIAGQVTFKFKHPYAPSFSPSSGMQGFIDLRVTIYVKDGKYKLLVTEPYYMPDSGYMRGFITADTLCPSDRVNRLTRKWCNKAWKDIRKEYAGGVSFLRSYFNKELLKNNDNW